MRFDTPCSCPRCGWLGTLRNAHASQNETGKYICPSCATETAVQTLAQKGLDGLRTECRLLTKMGYQSQMKREEKSDRMIQLEHFFQHIEAPL